jgi:beta-glucosidase
MHTTAGTAGCLDGITAQESEGVDRISLELPEAQQDLLTRSLAAAIDSGTRVVVVLVTGGALAVDELKGSHAAVLYAPYGGQSGGAAIVDILFGDVAPEGKLPITFYPKGFAASRLPWEMDLRAGEGVTHMFYTGTPIWPFGHGLSYTKFVIAIEDLTAVGEEARMEVGLADAAAAGVTFTVVVTNTGDVAAATVILAFVAPAGRKNAVDTTAPQQRLAVFDRVWLEAGQQRTVVMTAPPRSFVSIDANGRKWLAPGRFRVSVGDVLDPSVFYASVGDVNSTLPPVGVD